MRMPLLEVKNLNLSVLTGNDLLPVVRDVSFRVDENQTLGIVGESGCGKSLTSLAIMGLLGGTPISMTSGSIVFSGQELTSLTNKERRSIMGNQIAMIFQEPMTSLNPVYRVGDQIIESLRKHRQMTKTKAKQRAIELLDLVKIPEPENRVESYPHQLSGGQRQRVMIAMALACDPKLLIADEPTTALDVTVQDEVLALIRDLQQRLGTALILISHDLGVIANTCDYVAVMYRGKIVEAAPTADLFSSVNHPYTHGLLNSIPVIDRDIEWLKAIPGRVPTINEKLAGCAFNPRCNIAENICTTCDPEQITLHDDHYVRCHFAKRGTND